MPAVVNADETGDRGQGELQLSGVSYPASISFAFAHASPALRTTKTTFYLGDV